MTIDEEYNEQQQQQQQQQHQGEEGNEEAPEEFVLTKKRFSKMVEEYISAHPDSSYMDGVLAVCDERSIDPADISTLICRTIRQKIEAEAVRNNLVKSSTNSQELPI